MLLVDESHVEALFEGADGRPPDVRPRGAALLDGEQLLLVEVEFVREFSELEPGVLPGGLDDAAVAGDEVGKPVFLVVRPFSSQCLESPFALSYSLAVRWAARFLRFPEEPSREASLDPLFRSAWRFSPCGAQSGQTNRSAPATFARRSFAVLRPQSSQLSPSPPPPPRFVEYLAMPRVTRSTLLNSRHGDAAETEVDGYTATGR